MWCGYLVDENRRTLRLAAGVVQEPVQLHRAPLRRPSGEGQASRCVFAPKTRREQQLCAGEGRL